VATSLAHCGACGSACAPANAIGVCAAGACGIATCATGFADCDGSVANGCETDLLSNAAHCGGCGNACGAANASGACTAGVCEPWTCNAGWANCDGSPATGCEIDLLSNAAHCGACGNACAAGETCQRGACSSVPTAGLVALYQLDGDAADTSGLGNHGAVVGGVGLAADRFGRSGGALRLDGSTGYVQVDPSTAVLSLDQQQYTVAGWFSSDTAAKTKQTLFDTNPHRGIEASFNYDGLPGSVVWAVGDGGTWDVFAAGHRSDLVVGEWYFAAIRRDGATWTFFLDGVVDSEVTIPGASRYAGAVGYRFGAIYYPGYPDLEAFAGSLDDYRIYDRSLSLAEIRSLYTEGGFRKACAAPWTDCGGACVDRLTSPTDCGACGNACAGMEVCQAGACTPVTPLVDLRADLGVETSPAGTVIRWIDQSGNGFDATPGVGAIAGPALTTATVNGKSHPVLRFGGSETLWANSNVPPVGTLFAVLANVVRAGLPWGTLAFGWGQLRCSGIHGVGLVPASYLIIPDPAVWLMVRNGSTEGSALAHPAVSSMEVLAGSWGPQGVTLERRLADGTVVTSSSNYIDAVTDAGTGLALGGSADPCGWPWFEGDLAAFRAYSVQLSEADRAAVATALHAAWVAGP
jgi:hypothetical protein